MIGIENKKDMKDMRKILLAVALPAVALTAQSCLNDDDSYYDSLALMQPNAIVTVKPLDGGGFYMQLDDNTTLKPANMDKSPYKTETRAFVNYVASDSDSGDYDQAVNINWIDSVLTKPMVKVPEDVTDLDAEYGSDPVEILNSWVTVVEDGYFTINFMTYTNGGSTKHRVNLIQPDPTKPYELEFRHDADGDTAGMRAQGVAAFKLSALNLVQGEKITITLKWKSYSGEKSHDFEYTPGESVASGEEGGSGDGGDIDAGAANALRLK